MDVSASSYLEWDLGIDSLARTELILWVERSFGVRLPGAVTGEVETVSDLLHALEQAHPSAPAAPEAVAKPFLPNVPAATEARTLVEVLEWHAAQHPHRLHLTVLEDEATTLATMTYRELAEAAREAAQGMIDQDVVKVAAEAGLPLRATKHSARSADNAAHYGRHGRLGRSESRR